ncbi:hypothetical protein CCAX7_19430 [Capsulimonas corticalis]|uniref:Glycosyl transferase n=1 Tax=Capsulimonas corticalis TaxID=2219043 RepID=A0A402D560_9BACT|nr:glucoamylase family protein [Capsulimonas corticalis]BDI29892.1 hypothetical protein CCAX7_19430 [Capsulimonas corticalis]
MPDKVTAAGFYQDPDAAASVFAEIRRKCSGRVALISCNKDGKVSINNGDISPRRGVALGVLSGLIATLILLTQSSIRFVAPGHYGPFALLLSFVLAGGVLGWIIARFVRLGVDPALLAHGRRIITRGESAILVQTTAADIAQAMLLLRQVTSGQPVTFAFPPPPRPTKERAEILLRPARPASERLGVEVGLVTAAVHQVTGKSTSAKPLYQRLNESEAYLNGVQAELNEAVKQHESVSLSAEWLLDNAYIIQEHIDDIRRNFSPKFHRELPILASGPQSGLPRAYGIAAELIAEADAHVDQGDILNFLESYQTVTPLTMAELWALPLLMRLRLIEALRALTVHVRRRQRERILADFWANRLRTAARNDADRLLSMVSDLSDRIPNPSAHFADQLLGHLYDEEAALAPVHGWLERKLKTSVTEAIQQDQREQTAEQVSLGNAITTLRALSHLDWRDIFERCSAIHKTLSEDPAGVYAGMDFTTRDSYRHGVETIHKCSTFSEFDVAAKAISLAAQAPGGLERHVGYWLVDQGRPQLEASLNATPHPSQRLLRSVRRQPAFVYLGSIGLLTLLILWRAADVAREGGQDALFLIVLTLLAVLPASEVAVQVVNYLVTRLIAPQPLPKLSFEDTGIPDEYRTLVVVPMMLLTPDSIRKEVERLEIRYLANTDENLRYALVADYADAPQQHMPEDAERLDVAANGIRQLDERYGDGRFFLFARERKWNDSEDKWIGWERKRGKLEELNTYLTARPEERQEGFLRVGEPALLEGIKFVITLDADTQLPASTARRMVETLAHPLNRPVIAQDCSHVVRGYGILQPRVSTSLPSATATLFSQVFTDPTGTDPYTHAISDVYQDLTGEASYHGKGIYDLHAFHTVLTGRFPENHLLSHDLIEGSHVRVGLASDIELFDLFPEDYHTYANRQHRWVRGDWQITDWIFGTVPYGDGTRVRNPLPVMNRWKIFDNLRRSVMPIGITLLLVLAWLFSPMSTIWVLPVLAVFLMPFAFQILTLITTPIGKAYIPWADLELTGQRTLVNASFTPHQAVLAADAIVRVGWRRAITHKHLLEWTTAQEAQKNAKDNQSRFVMRLTGYSLASLAIAALIAEWHIKHANSAPIFLLLWTIFPLIVALLNLRTPTQETRPLVAADRTYLRRVARQTWRFFDEFVGPQTHWLPPDNYQEFVRHEVANRTSPTNIGLLLLADVAAHDFGYITIDSLIDRIGATMATIEKMEKYEGHLLNWYDTTTLDTLKPEYVSMVDSGNLLGHLWAMDRAVPDLLNGPLLRPEGLLGIADSLGLMREGVETQEKSAERWAVQTAKVEGHLAARYGGIQEQVERLRALHPLGEEIARNAERLPTVSESARYWGVQVREQICAWNETVDRYLRWVEVLAQPPLEGLITLSPDAHEWRRQALASTPSLHMIATGAVPGLSVLVSLHARKAELRLSPQVSEWLDRLHESAAQAQWLAGEQMGKAQAAIDSMRALADGMNMRFLYVPDRRVFSIGYSVGERRLDNSYYDLLASEARLGSFTAIARGDVPVEHWWALGRSFKNVHGRRVLQSWSGTMFEYLMPTLVTRTYQNSLLDSACKDAVATQRDYARRRGIPWGISEAAYSALDARQIYQYYAFGVPGMGLKRGLEDDLVVAPYATGLALAVDPPGAVRNLRRMAALAQTSLRGDYGFYESIDFTRQRGPKGERGVVVACYMAHHQGMMFTAIDNALNGNIMQERFHSDPRVRAVESLLFERIPAASIPVSSAREAIPQPRLEPIATQHATGTIDTPDTATPQVSLLSNGHYSVMVTNAGGGYSKIDDTEISRWRADATRDSYGQFCYVRDTESGAFWSTTYQPTTGSAQRFSALFSPDKAEFRRREYGIETVTEIVVSPEDNAEIRRITVINKSLRPRQIELTSYAELALAPHAADRAHPAFNKLFIQTEVLKDLDGMLAWRRPRSANEAPVWAAHVVAANRDATKPTEFETDRSIFLGRGRTPADPAALHGALTGSQGPVLDPVFALRKHILLEPGERAHVSFVTIAATRHDEAVALVEKYRNIGATARAMEMAWTHAQLELRHLRLQGTDVLRFQQLAGHMLYPNKALRPPAERLRRNILGQSRLWAQGISGDLPTMVVTIADTNDLEMVREALQAHTYWRVHGFKCDLVILNQESSSYEQPLQEQLRRMIQGHTEYTGIDQPGGVFLRPAAAIGEEDLTLILTVARVVLVAARGSLSQQLSVPIRPALPAPTGPAGRPASEEPSEALPFMELPYFNGLGGFTQDGHEYAIYLGPDDVTPAPWSNVMANPNFGALVTESGGGYCWGGNSQSNKLTPWSNDPVSDPVSMALYIRDEDLGIFWTPTAAPVRERDPYRTRHGQGYTIFEHNSHAIVQELTLFVPAHDNDGLPVLVHRLKLTNRSSHRRRLTVTGYVEWDLGVEREETQLHVVTDWDTEGRMITARNHYHPDFGSRIAFAAISPAASSYTGDRGEFLGRNGSVSSPAAMRGGPLSGRAGAGLDPCAALQTAIELEPGQMVEVIFTVGQTDSLGEARTLVQRLRSSAQAESLLQATRQLWDNYLGTIQVETPDLAVNFLLNRWLVYQDLSCRIWGRSAFYQSGGAFGFRDQLQDAMALVYSDPAMTRAQIVRSASRQFPEGDVQHWWHPPGGAGVRTQITDDLLWLPLVAAHYVKITGDTSVLDEVAPFLDGRLLGPDEHEAFFQPGVSSQTATVLEHCRRAIQKGLTHGPHDLPLIGAGDWNDGMNRVGIGGKGESVWLAWFLIVVLNEFAAMLRAQGAATEADEHAAAALKIAAAIDESAWDGAWYRRAYFDDGSPLGSAQDKEARIDSLPQSWAVISGAGDPARARQAMQSVLDNLVKRDDKMVLLFTPPFDKSPKDPGYIKGYLPGVRENGGQYTHGSLWVPLAFARLGDGDRAVEILRLMNPVEHARTPEDVQHYKVEPYVVAADVYSLAGKAGRGGWTWYTGSAGWMYRVWLEEVLGFHLRPDALTMNPVIPKDWKEFKLTYRHKSSTYAITIDNSAGVSTGVKTVEVDGQVQIDGRIPLGDDGQTHEVRVVMG